MRKGRPLVPLMLTQEEQGTLERWARRPKSAQALAQRARVILACADGASNTVVAARLKLTMQTVGKWRSRFVNKRLDGLLDEPRLGTPLRLSDREVEQVLAMTLESTPKDATHWSTRSMAQACGLSHTSVRRIWSAFALAPHRSETFKLSKDPSGRRSAPGSRWQSCRRVHSGIHFTITNVDLRGLCDCRLLSLTNED